MYSYSGRKFIIIRNSMFGLYMI